MIKINAKTKTLIIIGTGGVGKTTLAASFGVGLALAGKKILVLTIDPAKRLAQALNLKADGKLHKVKLPNREDGTGELWSCVIDHQAAFHHFVREAASGHATDEAVDNLLKNKLYQQLSGKLSGSQDFTSLVTLYRYVNSGEYDLVILDTPPAQHTYTFLKAPEKIANLFNEGIASWFRDDAESSSLFKKILNVGTTQVLKALEMMTGSEFIKELSAFFKAIQKWQKPLEDYVMNCHRLLSSAQTEFVMVTGLDASRLTEAEKLSVEIQTQGYQLTSVIINRVPEWLATVDSKKVLASKSPRLKDIIAYYQSLEKELQRRVRSFTTRQNVYKCYEFSQTNDHVQQLKDNFDGIKKI